MKRVFAENAWLGQGRFARRVLVEFDTHIRSVRTLREEESPPADAEQIGWLMPGLVNAHCHLEYTWLEDAGLPRGQVPFGEWMRAIMSRRPADGSDRERQAEAMREGARRLLAGGCTTVFDSTTDGTSSLALQEAGLRHFLFYEVLGLTQQRAESTWNAAIKWQQRPPPVRLIGSGMNPHAPYSVGEWLRERLLSDEAASLSQAWHLAETPDEEELFQTGTGSIADFFCDVGLPMPWEGIVQGPRSTAGRRNHPERLDFKGWASSFDFLCKTDQLDRCVLVFHGNGLSSEEAGFFRAPRGIVHCPGTHRWFDRPPAPLRHWLDAGVNVCLGTDSLASAETLSMMDVVRMTLEDHPDLSADDVLTMACINPWRINLGEWNEQYGKGIAAGGVADLVGLGGIRESSVTPEGDTNLRMALKDYNQILKGVWIAGVSAPDITSN